MRSPLFSPRTALVIITLAAAGLASAVAQAPTEKPPERRPAAREFLRDRAQFGGGQAMQAARFGFAMERVLTEEQRSSLRAAMEKQRDQMRPLEEKLRVARQDLLKATIAEKFDEAAVRKQALEIGKLDAELTVLRARAMSQMKPALSADQVEKLKNPPPFEPGEFRRDGGRGEPRQNPRPAEPRDENDLPPKPKAKE